jgi:hypothetical protein
MGNLPVRQFGGQILPEAQTVVYKIVAQQKNTWTGFCFGAGMKEWSALADDFRTFVQAETLISPFLFGRATRQASIETRL